MIGVLFGAGNGGSTVHTDGMGDGITNPASFCTSDGLSSGQICNNHTSSVSDDDGGYIRMQGQQYYAGGGYSLGGISPTSTATSTATATKVPPTQTLTPTRTATSTATATARTPVPTATATRTATPGGTPTFKDATMVQPSSPARGSSTTIHTTITATGGSLSNGIVDLEVYKSANWTKVGQQFFSGQNLSAGQQASYSYTWPVPNSAGNYTVMVGVFGPNWSPDYFWDSSAAAFSVP